MIYPAPKYITLNINEPKTLVHLNPSMDDVRETQVIDFVRVRKPFVNKQDIPQHVYKVEDDGSETQLLRFNVADHCPIEKIQDLFKKVNKGFFIIEVAGDWLIKSRVKIRLAKGIYTKLGVPKFLKRANLTLCSGRTLMDKDSSYIVT